MKRKNTEHIRSVIKTFLKENPEVQERIAEVNLLEKWSELLGASIARYTENLYIRNRTLYVRLSSSILKNELSMSRERLVKSLNDSVGKEVIDSIVFI